MALRTLRPSVGAASGHGRTVRVSEMQESVLESTTEKAGVPMKLWRIRRDLYRGARILGDVQAIERGPAAIARREVRKHCGGFSGGFRGGGRERGGEGV